MRALSWLLFAVLLGSGSGCRHVQHWMHPPPPCTFTPDASKQEIVAHVNRFVVPSGTRRPLSAWRATQVRVSFPGTPPVEGSIDVEAPSRIRIRAAMPFLHSDLADLGANDEEIWFWGQGAKEIITIRHEDLPLALQQMQIPFEPEWLMEVLSVLPLEVDDYELRRSADGKSAELVGHRLSPMGEPVIRVIRVDLCHGQIVEHRVEREDGTLIASARLSEYRPDASGQYVLPHLIQLEWPVMQTSLTLRLGVIQANPPSLGEQAWEVPAQAGLPRRRFLPQAAVPIQPAAARRSLQEPLLREADGSGLVRLGTISDEPAADGPPAAYSPEAWQSSSDPPLRAQGSGPRPFP